MSTEDNTLHTIADNISPLSRERGNVKTHLLAQRRVTAFFSLFSLVFVAVSILYFSNIVNWSKFPFSGISISTPAGRLVLTNVWGDAKKAGLLIEDKVISVNGVEVSSFDHLRSVRNIEMPGSNTYEIERDGQILIFDVPNRPLGLKNAFTRFGLYWVLSIVFFSTGAIVFVMKPGMRSSWSFFLAMFFVSLDFTFYNSGELSPAWFGGIYIFGKTMSAAALLQLAQTFPVDRQWFRSGFLSMFLPYVLSALLCTTVLVFYGTSIADVPAVLKLIIYGYVTGALVTFIFSAVYNYRRPLSDLARTRAKIILLGAAFSTIPPLVNLLSVLLFKILLFLPVYNLPFFVLLPAITAYAITKHNLFDVDVYIKRAVGYGLMTAIVATTYLTLQVVLKTIILEPLIGDSAENVYPVIFALFVVFFFNPINTIIQGFVDKLFYRKDFDYKDTVLSVSNALTSVLKLDEVIQRIIQTVKKEMFIDVAGVILVGAANETNKSFFMKDEGIKNDEFMVVDSTAQDDPLLELIGHEKKMLTIYEIAEDAQYAEVREVCSRRFDEMGSSIAIPLIYQGEVNAVLALGHKKSGKFYTREDIDLLETLSNQAAIAIENARLFEENLEKTRMEEELKIAHDIQASMLPEHPPQIDGYTIAATSFSAREVGGDFFDFVEMGDEDTRKIGIIVGDVSGKAVSGALVMAASRSIFRVLADPNVSVRDMMMKGNRRLKHDVKKGMFVALSYALLDPDEKIVTIVNAGQTQPILCRTDSHEPEFIDTEGDRFPLGIIADSDYQETSVSLKSGDTMVFYTDGIVEAMNVAGDMYGFDHFIEKIEENKLLDANAFLGRLMADVTRFVGDAEQHDDLTIVVLKVD